VECPDESRTKAKREPGAYRKREKEERDDDRRLSAA
jgi:hypothetical protein